MKTWDRVIKDALAMHVHADQYAYFYGAKGERLTIAVMRALMEKEPEYWKRYTDKQIAEIMAFSVDRIGYDCSGFIGKVTGCNTYSGAIWDRCTDKTTPAKGPAGSILWKPGHVGLDIGMGFYLQTGKEGESITMGRISENVIKWEGSGRLSSYIDYTGASDL